MAITCKDYRPGELQKIASSNIYASAVQFEKDGVCEFDMDTENLALYCDELARKMMRKFTASSAPKTQGDFWDAVHDTIEKLRTEYENPTPSRQLYDELCALLTDYEGNGSTVPVSVGDMYSMLVKIQNNWEIINAER